jgi:hypothetical protein
LQAKMRRQRTINGSFDLHKEGFGNLCRR